jgi:hypothetical protein
MCEQTKRDKEKQISRFPSKVRWTIWSHAARLKMKPQELRERYGWDEARMIREAQDTYGNGCPYCGRAFGTMHNPMFDLTLDIWNPTKPPDYGINTRWVCRSCRAQPPKALIDQDQIDLEELNSSLERWRLAHEKTSAKEQMTNDQH